MKRTAAISLVWTATMLVSSNAAPCTVWWEHGKRLVTPRLCGTLRSAPRQLLPQERFCKITELPKRQPTWRFIGADADAQPVPGARFTVREYKNKKLGRLVASGSADDNAWVDVKLLPGRYILDVTSPAEKKWGQVEFEIEGDLDKVACGPGTSLIVSLESCSDYLEQRFPPTAKGQLPQAGHQPSTMDHRP